MPGYWRLSFLYNFLSPDATRPCAMHEFTAQITDLRNNLGFTVREVARSGNPVIVRRYDGEEVILVPLDLYLREFIPSWRGPDSCRNEIQRGDRPPAWPTRLHP